MHPPDPTLPPGLTAGRLPIGWVRVDWPTRLAVPEDTDEELARCVVRSCIPRVFASTVCALQQELQAACISVIDLKTDHGAGGDTPSTVALRFHPSHFTGAMSLYHDALPSAIKVAERLGFSVKATLSRNEEGSYDYVMEQSGFAVVHLPPSSFYLMCLEWRYTE